MKEKILVTAIGTVTATAIVRKLKEAGYYVIGADCNERTCIATSLDVDEYYQFPMITYMQGYVDYVLSFCRDHRITHYYAVLDKEVVAISRNRDRFTHLGTKLCVPNAAFAETCHFKDRFDAWIQKEMPEIAIKSFPDRRYITDSDFPLFVKPFQGVASTGCRPVCSRKELESIRETEILIQRMETGAHITVDMARDAKGHMTCIPREELLRNGNGCGIAVETLKDERLEEICCQLMEKLDLRGVANAEFFRAKEGYKIIEINPRFSAGTLYSCMAGVNMVLYAKAIADGADIQKTDYKTGARFAERYEPYFMG